VVYAKKFYKLVKNELIAVKTALRYADNTNI